MYGVLMLNLLFSLVVLLTKVITKKALSLSISNQTKSFKGLSLSWISNIHDFCSCCHVTHSFWHPFTTEQHTQDYLHYSRSANNEFVKSFMKDCERTKNILCNKIYRIRINTTSPSNETLLWSPCSGLY